MLACLSTLRCEKVVPGGTRSGVWLISMKVKADGDAPAM
jgi:hypothetical protein